MLFANWEPQLPPFSFASWVLMDFLQTWPRLLVSLLVATPGTTVLSDTEKVPNLQIGTQLYTSGK